MIYPCGCEIEFDPASGVLRSVAKCGKHQPRDPATLDAAYYAEFGLIKDGRPVPSNHVAEMTDALGPFDPPRHNATALEIGCGVSPYVRDIQRAGWHYTGLDVSPWAAQWVSSAYGVVVTCGLWETWQPPAPVGMILAAHSLEHMADAPDALAKMADALAPGGVLYLLVPDDSDPANPDHLWFFTEATLRQSVEAAGLFVEKSAMRRIVKHENFLYVKARKP